ncbi:hypothetical protein ACMBCN_02720, partial [Candidatus Liberibacter asiaticus]|nr:hypothetical protein [Candidatus Liberibacter asiaticus]
MIRIQKLKLRGNQLEASSNKEEEEFTIEEFNNLLIETSKGKDVQKETKSDEIHFINSMDKVINHKWCSKVTIIINKEYQFTI